MPLHFINTLKSKAGDLAYSSFLYNWSLHESAPDRLIARPVDPWPGNAQKAQNLLDAAGVGERTGAVWYEEWWSPEDADEIWHTHMHSFDWLRDLRTLDGALAREQGRLMIESWVNRYGCWDAQSWRIDLIGRRISMWICHYDFFCANATEQFEDKFLASLVKQTKHLSNALTRSYDISSIKTLEAIKGLLYAAISLEGHEKWIEQALTNLESTINTQILSDGGHISRNPETLLEALELIVDMRTALSSGGYPTPEFLSDTIDNMSSALRLFRYRDRKFGLFHGAQEGNAAAIDSILAQAGTHKPTKRSLEQTGFERLECGRSLLVMDTGRSQKTPYDKTAHAAPLAFEFSYGKERIITACGSHPSSQQWQDALRSTAAHSTGCLDYRNACEIKKNGHFERKAIHCTLQREDTKDASLLVASHDGYVALNGITHTRRVYLADEGHDLRGQDDFSCGFELICPVETAIRFHLHPNVSASFINDGEEIILRIPGGIGWRFSRSAGMLALEDSLYLGHGTTAQKTKQIVIYGQMAEDEACMKWSLKRES
ncbi:MAG: heparinase [Alphaproteobacteria bacterium]|nr:MAG: heparinase [Alphaproteobacteria bacterium]